MIDNIKNVKEQGRNAELIMKHVLKLSKIIINEKSIALTIPHELDFITLNSSEFRLKKVNQFSLINSK